MKRILIIAMACMAAGTAHAQYTYGEPVESSSSSAPNNSYKKTRIGLFIAPNSCWMKPTSSKSNDGLYLVTNEGSKIGYTWGVQVDYFFTENYGISTGAQITTSGGKVNALYDVTKPIAPTAINTVKSASMDYRLQYFEVPFGLKLMTDNLTGGLRVFGNIGITAALNIGRKGTYEVIYSDTSNVSPTGMADKTVTGENEKLRKPISIIPILFQMNLGAGIEYQLTSKMSFYTGLFFNNGFAPDVTSPKDLDLGYKGSFTDGNIRLNSLSLKVGIFF